MDLSVASGMKQHPVVGGIFSPVHPPHKMVVVPSCECGDLLLADRTESFLLFPEGDQLPFPLEIVHHFYAEALFKVLFPSRIIGVGFSLNFHMSLDRDMSRVQEIIFYDAFFGCDDSVEDPILPFDGFKVSLFNPLFRLVGVPPFRPLPQGLEDGMANSCKGDFADDVLVIVRPSPNDRVQLNDQVACRRLLIGLDERSYFPQEGGDVLSRWFDDELAMVLAYIVRIGRALRPFPPSKRSGRVSSHSAFQYST